VRRQLSAPVAQTLRCGPFQRGVIAEGGLLGARVKLHNLRVGRRVEARDLDRGVAVIRHVPEVIAAARRETHPEPTRRREAVIEEADSVQVDVGARVRRRREGREVRNARGVACSELDLLQGIELGAALLKGADNRRVAVVGAT
jgi:hypothetical protein